MNRAMRTISGIGLGAGLMYVLDPDKGRRRRAIVRDKLASAAAQSRHAMGKTSRDFSNRAHGFASSATSVFRGHESDDDVLVARVRAKLGRAVSHPGAIEVESHNGLVVLRGPVLRHEVDNLLDAVASVDGVMEIENRLDLYKESDNVPALQGGTTRQGERLELFQTNWTPAVRFMMGTAGAILVANALREKSVLSSVAGMAGIVMLARAATNKEVKRLIGVASGRRAVDIQKTIVLNVPVEEAFAFWTNYQNFPRFMTHIKEVRNLGHGRSHWVAAGPAGIPVTWDAEITEYVPNRMLAWKSSPGSRIENAGIVRFDPNPSGGTRVQIRMSYNPPAGAIGHIVASLFGADPKHEMDQDLVRMKSLLEIGKTRSPHGETVRREEFAGFAPRDPRL